MMHNSNRKVGKTKERSLKIPGRCVWEMCGGCMVLTLMALRETPLADPLTLRPEMTSETVANDMVLL